MQNPVFAEVDEQQRPVKLAGEEVALVVGRKDLVHGPGQDPWLGRPGVEPRDQQVALPIEQEEVASAPRAADRPAAECRLGDRSCGQVDDPSLTQQKVSEGVDGKTQGGQQR